MSSPARSHAAPRLSRRELDAAIFDLDGVLTDTAALHARAWKDTFDPFLAARDPGSPPFDLSADYRRFVDGRPRYQGALGFLNSRGLALPAGRPQDPPGTGSVCALGNLKRDRFLGLLEERGVHIYPDAAELLDRLRHAGFACAVVTASRNGERILRRIGWWDRFGARVDGVVAAELGLAGKPAPDTFLQAARELGVPPGRAAVLEDAPAGVKAGRAGGFGLVVGVARSGDPGDLTDADVVVSGLAQLEVEGE